MLFRSFELFDQEGAAQVKGYSFENAAEGDELDIPTILREKKFGTERLGARL